MVKTRKPKTTRAERFLDEVQAAIESGNLRFDEEHFGPGGHVVVQRMITTDDVVAVLLGANGGDCERTSDEQEHWEVTGGIEDGRCILVITIVNDDENHSVFVVTAHNVIRGET